MAWRFPAFFARFWVKAGSFENVIAEPSNLLDVVVGI